MFGAESGDRYFDAFADVAPSRDSEPDPVDTYVTFHMDHCGVCSDGQPCRVLTRIVGVYWR